MIIGVGIDTILTARINKLNQKFGNKFAQKIFTDYEISQALIKKNLELQNLFYAKRFAAKEAFSKAIGLGIGRGINFRDIEIKNNNLGKPQIKILNNKENFLQEHFDCKNFTIHLSITDQKTLASAVVIIEKSYDK